MIISPNRIERHLAHASFRLSYSSATTGDSVFARRVGPTLFERISVERATTQKQGRKVDLLGASAECTIVPGRTAVKGLAVAEYLRLPSCSRTGHATIMHDEDAARWLAEMSAAGPLAARAACLKHGETLMASTAEVRKTAAAYLQKLPAHCDIEQAIASLRGQATDSQCAQAAAWLSQRIIVIPGAAKLYEAACLLISLFQDDVEGEIGRFIGKEADDVPDRRLMLRLQYLASRIANETGWDWSIIAHA